MRTPSRRSPAAVLNTVLKNTMCSIRILCVRTVSLCLCFMPFFSGNCHSSSTTCTGPSVPVSAGCTPRYARKFSTTTSQVTVPVRKSLLDTPIKNVSTAHEMFGIHSHSAQAVRSEMIANIDAEDAGRTPIQLSPLPITKKTTDDQSRMTTWTPSKMSEGGGSPAGKPI